nr:hypothetical protein [Micromonospora sp. DSM 115978]
MTESTPENSYPSWNPEDYAPAEELQQLLELKAALSQIDALEDSGLDQRQSKNVTEIKEKTSLQLSVLWGRISNRAEQAFARSLYRTQFASVSLGTEEEIRAT